MVQQKDLSYEALLAEFDSVDNRLGWREEKGILHPEERSLLELTQLLRPFLKVLIDIRDALNSIANCMPR